jgi:sugar phosphate permease
LVNFATATQCKRCGTLFTQNVSSASGSNLQGFVLEDGYVLPPPPSLGLPGAGIWRDRATLVMTKEAQLPDRCVKCNVLTNRRLRRKFAWHHPAIYLLLLVAWFVYLIVAMIVRKRATIDLGLCDEHSTKRRTYIWTSWLLALGGVAGFVLAILVSDGTPVLVGILLLLTAIVFAFITTRVGYPSKIDDRFVWLKGINAEYLNQLPQWPGY